MKTTIVGLFGALAVGLGALAIPADAETLVFQEGKAIEALGIDNYTGSSTLTLISTASYATKNYGRSTSLTLGKGSNGEERKALLRFDVSALANFEGTITSVTLTLTAISQQAAISNGNTTLQLNLYQIADANAGWVQGNGQGSSELGSASYNYKAIATTTWAGSAGLGTPGTDYVDSVIDGTHTVYGGTSITPTQYSWELPVSLLQSWISGTNAGLLLTVTGFDDLELKDIVGFASNRYTNIDYRPMLTITYTPVPETPLAGVLPLLGVYALYRMRRQRKTVAAAMAAMVLGGSVVEAWAEEVVKIGDGKVADVILIAGENAGRHYGMGNTIWIGTGPNGDLSVRRSLLRVDVSELPKGKKVKSAKLVLKCAAVKGQPGVWEVYAMDPLNDGWREDKEVLGKAATNLCSWNFRHNHYQKWTGGEGGGVQGEPIYRSNAAPLKMGETVEIDLPVGLVEQWRKEPLNAGLLLKMADENFGDEAFIRFGSSEHQKEEMRPVLVVELQ